MGVTMSLTQGSEGRAFCFRIALSASKQPTCSSQAPFQ